MKRAIILVLALVAIGCEAEGTPSDPRITLAPGQTPYTSEEPPASGPSEEIPSVEPTDEPTVAGFKTISLSGKGDKVAKFKIPEDAAAIADVTYGGGGNFALWTVDASGAEADLLVNVIGKYSGTVLFDTDSHSVAFKVESSGSWKVKVRAVSTADAWDPGKRIKGKGDAVYRLSPTSSGLTTARITHNGEGNFAIWSYAPDGADLLVNEIGDYDGEVLLADGTFLISIEADGSWSLAPS